jgi:hypothetical protein
MVTSIDSTAALAYAAATPTASTGASSTTPTTFGVAPEVVSSTAAVSVTLSSNAQRLQTAEQNLSSLESSKTYLSGTWTSDYAAAASLDITNEAAADTELSFLPASDQAHIQQATAAQKFVKATINSQGNAVSAPNPFAGLSTTSLTAIISDKSGLYTSYEKAAAQYEYSDQQNAWQEQYSSSSQQSGDWSTYYSKVISVYNGLPSLIQASYAPNYLQNITDLLNKSKNGAAGSTATSANTPASQALQVLQDSAATAKASATKANNTTTPGDGQGQSEASNADSPPNTDGASSTYASVAA